MENFYDVKQLSDKIFQIKHLLLELESAAEQFPALSRNSKRALASIKMLELNISDVVAFDLTDA